MILMASQVFLAVLPFNITLLWCTKFGHFQVLCLSDFDALRQFVYQIDWVFKEKGKFFLFLMRKEDKIWHTFSSLNVQKWFCSFLFGLEKAFKNETHLKIRTFPFTFSFTKLSILSTFLRISCRLSLPILFHRHWSSGFSRTTGGAPDTMWHAVLFKPLNPISGWTIFRVSRLLWRWSSGFLRNKLLDRTSSESFPRWTDC